MLEIVNRTCSKPCYDHGHITRDTGGNEKQEHGAKAMSSDAGIAVVRRNTEEVQGRGNFEVFEELFAPDFVDHTPQPGGFTPDRDGARNLYRTLRAAQRLKRTMAHTKGHSGDWRRPGARSTSRPSTSCACATARSPTTGGSRISCPLCSNLA